ncbi:hypothetical protein CWS43_12095 [Rahnella sp. AA]|uniref:T6SS immunity protein Tli3 family protein n=1 Tax=Rahnella sp. AA TaxID=2057180 RepID=UPI000C331A16|nr:hypothetical protein [Rahnella sp. AA]PKE30360.1 hypothetical protein CWS43_12095 [Rahnella sp. AA]
MKMISRIAASLAGVVIVSGCHGRPAETPTQVIYRFDDHRYLEIKGFYCEGALWYTDTKRGIKVEVWDKFYRAFGQIYINPSERYIAVPSWDGVGMTVSKNYGEKWQPVRLSGFDHPGNKELHSVTVVDDRAYLLVNDGRLYTSSAPFDDPRIMEGGTGIDYIDEYGDKHHLRPNHTGPEWGLEFIKSTDLHRHTAGFLSNWQDVPQKVPEVKNYQGWDHMKCNPDLGLTAK